MTEMRDKYESFVAANELSEENVHNLLRLCGYAPLESDALSVPRSFEELEALCASVDKKYGKSDLLRELRVLFDDDYCSKDELRSMLSSGDKLSEDEFEAFYEQQQPENGMVNLEALVDWLMRK